MEPDIEDPFDTAINAIETELAGLERDCPGIWAVQSSAGNIRDHLNSLRAMVQS